MPGESWSITAANQNRVRWGPDLFRFLFAFEKHAPGNQVCQEGIESEPSKTDLPRPLCSTNPGTTRKKNGGARIDIAP